MSQSWWQLDWVWTTTGWVLAALGAVLLLWSLFSDRSRGKRRCPKCWYDMTGVPGQNERAREMLTCPECGRRSPARRLYRTRRKWFRAFAACLILLSAWGAANWRAYAAGGWVRLIPSTGLALWAPTDFQFTNRLSSRSFAGSLPVRLPAGFPARTAGFGPASTPAPTSARQSIGEEVWRRIDEGSMWKWQSQILIARALRESHQSIANRVFVAPAWPAGEPVPALVERYPSDSGPFGLLLRTDIDKQAHTWDTQDNAVTIMPTGAGKRREVIVPLSLRTGQGVTVYTEKVHREVTVSKTWNDLFTPDASDQTSRDVQAAMDPRLCINGDDVTLVMDERSNTPRWTALTLGMGARIEITIDSKPAAVGVFRPQWSQAVFKSWEELRMEWQPGMKAKARAAPETVRVTVHGDPEVSGEIYRLWPFVGRDPACWTGSFEATPRVVDRPEKIISR
jgi:hypothetical protein